jgi:hypothetical protein
MRWTKNLILNSTGRFKTEIWLVLVFPAFIFQSCTCERSDLKIDITNLTSNPVYIGNLYAGCDSCDIMHDITQHDLRLINSGEICHLQDKLVLDTIRGFFINSDSLHEYWKKGQHYNIANKAWVKVYSEKVDFQNKKCTVLIKW